MRLYEINVFWLLSANQVRPAEQNPSEAARAVLFSLGTLLQAYPSSLQGSASCSAAAVELGKVPALPVRNSKWLSWHLPKSAGSRLSSSLCSSQHSQKGIAKFASLTRFKRISSLLLGTKNPQVCSHYHICSLNRCFAVAFLKIPCIFNQWL